MTEQTSCQADQYTVKLPRASSESHARISLEFVPRDLFEYKPGADGYCLYSVLRVVCILSAACRFDDTSARVSMVSMVQM